MSEYTEKLTELDKRVEVILVRLEDLKERCGELKNDKKTAN